MLRNTYIGAWLAYVRIQSVPVTVVSLCLGYASVTGTVVRPDILPLLLVGFLGHTGVYAHNDYIDKDNDIEDGKDHKPLPGGDISSENAWLGMSVLMTSSILIATWYFSVAAFICYIIAFIIGLVYNHNSKESLYGGVYLTIWGMAIVLTGATYAGWPSIYTFPLILLLGVHMFWMTIEGSLKDLGKGEISLPKRFGSEVFVKDGEEYIFVSYRTMAVIHLLLFIHLILYISFPVIGIILEILQGISWDMLVYVIHLIITIILSDKLWHTMYDIVEQSSLKEEDDMPFDRDKFKRDIAKHTVVVVSIMIFASILFIDILSIGYLIMGSVVWGLGWQTALYGDPFYFP